MRHLLLALAFAALAGAANAQAPSGGAAYPSRPIRFVVPYFPGGTPDIQGRRLAEKLRERFGQPVVVDNRPGANASIGMGIVARAPADGYTIVIAPVGPWAVNRYLYKLPYDVLKDFAPIIHITTTPGVLVVHLSVPATTVKELIALAKQKPGELNYGSTGVGGFGHMCGELFTLLAGVKMTHVPHKSIAAALSDVMGGHLQVLFNVASPTIPQIRAGKVRALGTTGATRFEALPDVPTIAEAGVPGYENTTWNAIAAPARTPQPVIQRLNREINAILQLPDVREAARVEGSTIIGGTPEQFRKFLQSELAKYGKLVRAAGIKYE
ncbi:MAG: tripartite tricarboxylate transporter substrate binding protein [Betaproteobacteria bacterium]|nr:tripartite tricarboxylate transporter substrate binding protein [Betaproteobacteria bacterium]